MADDTTARIRRQLEDVQQALDAMHPERGANALEKLADPAQMLVRLRNDAIAAQRANTVLAPPDLLRRLNQFVSVMASLEYPLGGIHWPRIESLRKEVKGLADAMDSG